MGIDTVLLAIGEGDEHLVDEFADVARDLAGSTDSTVVVSHVFDEDTYERAVDELEETSPQETAYEGYVVASPPEALNAGFGSTAIGRGVDRDADVNEGSRGREVDAVARRHDAIVELVDALEAADLDYEIRGGVGDPADTVVGMAREVDADFVVVGGRDRSAATETLFGSVSRSIIESAPCPVVSVRAGD